MQRTHGLSGNRLTRALRAGVIALTTGVVFALAMQPTRGGAHDPGHCDHLAGPALELHEEMRRMVHAYSSLREDPEAEDHLSGVLLAADETINALIEIIDETGKVLVCMGVWEYTSDEDLGA